MKKWRGFRALALSGVMVMVFLLAACRSENSPAVTDTMVHLIGGEHTYTIIYDKDFGKNEVSACEALNERLGGSLVLTADQDENGGETAGGEYEILLGMTNRPESAALGEGLGRFDYRIAIEKEKLVVVGGSEEAFINAIALLVRGEDISAEGTIARDYNFYFDGADTRDEYIANPDLFLCNWALKFDVPEWMTDFEEKIAAFADTDGRMMSSIHRSDSLNYPENSIEGVISAMKMGADNIEIDVRLTSDGVAVLMHDESLKRTTDWIDKAGKNGLPESEKLSDWTFEQLRQLRLTAKSGDDNEYLIPTLKEVLQVCNERTTVRLDKFDVWDWDKDIYPLIQETGAWRTCILSEFFSLAKRQEIVRTIKEDSGKDVLMFQTFSHSKSEEWEVLKDTLNEKGCQFIAIWRDPDVKYIKRYVRQVQENLIQVKDDTRIYMFAHTLFGGTEDAESWDYLYENGIDFVVADIALEIQKYIAENFEPTPY